MKKYNKKTILNILYCYFIYSFLYKTINTTIISIIPLLLTFMAFYCKSTLKDEINNTTNRKIFIIFSVVVALLLNIGQIVYENIYNLDITILKLTLNLDFLIKVIGAFNLIYLLICLSYKAILKINLNENSKKTFKLTNWKLFIIFAIVILICWIPYLLTHWPGIFSSDSIDQVTQALKEKPLINHHPIAHTMFIKLGYFIGSIFFKNYSNRLVFVPIFQMIIMASIFSYTIIYLKNRNVNKTILILMLLYFALNPMIAIYSITVWKDVLFGAFVLLLFIQSYDLIINKNNLPIKKCILYSLNLLIISLLRNNAIYMLLILFIVALIIFKNNRIKISVTILSVFIVYYIITIGIFSAFNIKSTSITESLGIPLQQIARVVVKEGNINKEEEAFINNILPIEEIKQVYSPTTVDRIKFNSKYNGDFIKDNSKEFIIVYLNIIRKNFLTCVESYLYSTIGFWYPNMDGVYIVEESYENKYFTQKNLLPNAIDTLLDKGISKSNPCFLINWSLGSMIIIAVFCLIIMIIKQGISSLFIYTPIIGLWLTIMIATPVYSDFRYIFFMYCSFPITIILPFISDKKNFRIEKKNEKKKH